MVAIRLDRLGAYCLKKAECKPSNLLGLNNKLWKNAMMHPSNSEEPSRVLTDMKLKVFHKIAPQMFVAMNKPEPLPRP